MNHLTTLLNSKRIILGSMNYVLAKSEYNRRNKDFMLSVTLWK